MDLEQRTRSIVAEPLYTAMGSIAGIRTVIYVAEAGVHLLTHAPDLNSLLGQIGVVLFEGPEEKVVEDAKYVASG